MHDVMLSGSRTRFALARLPASLSGIASGYILDVQAGSGFSYPPRVSFLFIASHSWMPCTRAFFASSLCLYRPIGSPRIIKFLIRCIPVATIHSDGSTIHFPFLLGTAHPLLSPNDIDRRTVEQYDSPDGCTVLFGQLFD